MCSGCPFHKAVHKGPKGMEGHSWGRTYCSLGALMCLIFTKQLLLIGGVIREWSGTEMSWHCANSKFGCYLYIGLGVQWSSRGREGKKGRDIEPLAPTGNQLSVKEKKLKAIGSPERINICKLTIITIFLNFFEEVFGCNFVVISSTWLLELWLFLCGAAFCKNPCDLLKCMPRSLI